MVSYETCNAGGQHEFDTEHDDDFGNDRIVNVLECGKCSEVFERRTSTTNGQYKHRNCELDTCSGSDNGHNWEFNKRDYLDSCILAVYKCPNCNGDRWLEFNRISTEYIDANGNVI